jgi:hypothetical protein
MANAMASKWTAKSWHISMFGGMARKPHMTREAFALIACHEIGHHLGGAPHVKGTVSNEGQADYFATLKCMRRFFADENNEAAIAKLPKSEFVETECTSEFSDRKDQLICIRSSQAGYTLANIMREMRKAESISFRTPEKKLAKFMDSKHPAPQCRLDTYFNGARCPVPESEALSHDSFYTGTCDREGEGANTGSRPRCWFNPTKPFQTFKDFLADWRN